MSIYQMWSTVLCIGMFTFILGACEQQGPAERTGEKIDEAVEEAGEAMEKAGDKVKEATEQP